VARRPVREVEEGWEPLIQPWTVLIRGCVVEAWDRKIINEWIRSGREYPLRIVVS
jgi:hypothetical protein